MRLADKNLIKAALNIYSRHLKGFDDTYKEDIKRVEELKKATIKANSVCINIQLDI